MSATVIESESSGSTAILRISGDITSGSEGDLTAAYAAAVDGGARTVILDFAGLAYMNSGGIGLLVTLLVRAQRAGVHLMATGLSDHYRQIFELTGLFAATTTPDAAAPPAPAAGA